MFFELKPTSSQFIWSIYVTVISLFFLLIVMYLCYKDTLSYALARLFVGKSFSPMENLLESFFVNGDYDLTKHPILRRTIRILIFPLTILVLSSTAMILFQYEIRKISIFSSFGWLQANLIVGVAIGAALGLLCYLSSRYRVPAITIQKKIPTQRFLDISFRELKLTVRMRIISIWRGAKLAMNKPKIQSSSKGIIKNFCYQRECFLGHF